MDFLIKYILSAKLLILVYLLSTQVSAIGIEPPSNTTTIEVVTNFDVPERELTQSQLRRIYTMRQLRWSDNSAITVFVLPTQHSLHQRFAKERLQVFPYQLNRIWHKLTYSGLGVAPIIVESEQELIEAVVMTPGAIGYINKTTLMDNLNESLADTVIETSQRNVNKGRVHVVKITD